jgi:Carboxypeptidase regulatory-like domain/TonB-dependent Receptor Plug Domain
LSVWFFVWLAVPSMLAQVGTDGSILGTVRDGSGAVVPGAEITVRNLETGLTKTTVSDVNGQFEILALPRGVYSAAVSLASFKTWRLQSIELTVGEQKRISPVLAVGDVTQEVTVEGGVELVQTEKASVEGVIEQKQIRELPLNGRNAIALVNMVPGMRFQGVAGLAREHTVQGLGQRDDQTRFLVDGIDSNDPSNDKGIAFPNVDTVAQFSVLTSNFTAENGKNPIQVVLVTKGGTNEFHGTLWEFHRNDVLAARNAFAATKPKLIRNQYGFTVGGPVVKNRTFFFTSFEGTKNREERIYNAVTIFPEMLEGDFSRLPGTITDPLTNAPFPGNQIPTNRFSSASKFFFPHLLLPNAAGNRFQAVAPTSNDLNNFSLRFDQQLTSKQRVYVRWIRVGQDQVALGYRPEIVQDLDLFQHNVGLNYNWTITPKTLFDLALGYLHSDTFQTSPSIGKENLTQQAGIQGFSTEGRAEAVGLPNVAITGYSGFSLPNNFPGVFRREDINGKASINLIRSQHSLGFGYEYNDRRTLARHASESSRGTFSFNGQYTGNGFADYLLGMLNSDARNFPLKTFGMAHSPYSAFYVQDFWRLHPSLTLSLGLRYDRWHEKAFVRNNGATFDLTRGKSVAAQDESGHVDLTAQATAPFLAKATEGLWITADEAGMPRGLFEADGHFSPRFGIAWRPMGNTDLVVRGGYGLFPTSFNGNIVGSAIIGPPYWSIERQTFARATLQRWETAFPLDPQQFTLPSVAAVVHDARPMKIHEWNLSVQKSLPFLQSALTLAYVGNRGRDLVTQQDHNEVAPGRYTNLQAAKPYPRLGTVRLYDNLGSSWYDSMQLKFERRFTRGLSYSLAYAFARNIDEFGALLTDRPTPFAPEGYDRGRSQLETRHVLNLNSIWELPFGRGKPYASGLHPVANAFLGGWQFSGIYDFASGTPLTFVVPGATLGNGLNARPDLVGNLKLDDPSANLWFNPAALARPADFTFGNSGVGLIDGPGAHILDTSLMKNFYFGEQRYVQFRWELFNALNHVNLENPNVTINQPTTGVITGAGPARQMQFALKIVF